MKETLPRELRDMIWSFCWADSLNEYDACDNERPWRAHSVHEDTVTGVEYEESEYDIEPHRRAQALGQYPIGHLADTEYMSPNSARESVEMFYRMAPAFIETLDQRALQNYFCDDIFGLGLEPRNYVTSVVFFLHHCEFREDIDWGRPGRCLSFLRLHKESKHTIFGCRRDRLPGVVFHTSGNATTVQKLLDKAIQLFHQLNDIRATITIKSDLHRTKDFP
ncbi:hypothetical protein HBH53_187140 [Parastagonospora nodorum]|nr:hypothetical protein HBH53_187140 [Parastagonospora nodorum]KAH3961573.1 hypothetical protein HBH51_182340 [Parastagonospora nodorum]KAH3993536.1 hypothetical protein HBI10_202280 [Parastagonospora nodorum]KAH4011723.1 hypothetical protein HBI13_195960 [Parastagonospora nodorum]KAH4060233.1 hypothetical protein HBH50_223900 [Parastagonospora nodorum]